MNKKLVRYAASFLMLMMLFMPALAMAQNQYFSGARDLELPKNDSINIVDTVTNIINVVLGLLGLIAVIIILIGGFKWMTAQGSEEKVEDAKKTITYGIIGLAIILLAYIIVRVVIAAVYQFGESGTITP